MVIDTSDVVHNLLLQRDQLTKAFAAMDAMARAEHQQFLSLVTAATELAATWGPGPYSPEENVLLDVLAGITAQKSSEAGSFA